MPGFICVFLSLEKSGWDQEEDTRGHSSYTAIPYLNTLRKTKKIIVLSVCAICRRMTLCLLYIYCLLVIQ